MNGLFANKHFKKLISWGIPVIILLFWFLTTQFNIVTENIIPKPITVIRSFIDLCKSGEMLDDVLVSTKRAVLGFLVGGVIGFGLGLSNGLSKLSEYLMDTTIQMLRNIPILALIPLVIMWLGIGEEAKVVMVAFGVFFPIYLNTFHGIRSVDKNLIEMGRVYGLSSKKLFVNIIMPGAMPSILVGIQFSLGTMWLVLIAAETVSTDSGIGYLSMNAREMMRMDIVLLCIIAYAVLGKISDIIAKILERQLLKWNPEYSKK